MYFIAALNDHLYGVLLFHNYNKNAIFALLRVGYMW